MTTCYTLYTGGKVGPAPPSNSLANERGATIFAAVGGHELENSTRRTCQAVNSIRRDRGGAGLITGDPQSRLFASPPLFRRPLFRFQSQGAGFNTKRTSRGKRVGVLYAMSAAISIHSLSTISASTFEGPLGARRAGEARGARAAGRDGAFEATERRVDRLGDSLHKLPPLTRGGYPVMGSPPVRASDQEADMAAAPPSRGGRDC